MKQAQLKEIYNEVIAGASLTHEMQLELLRVLTTYNENSLVEINSLCRLMTAPSQTTSSNLCDLVKQTKSVRSFQMLTLPTAPSTPNSQ